MPDRLLDTNALAAALRNDQRLSQYLAGIGDCRLSTSVVVEGELRFGVLRLPRGRRRADLARRVPRFLTQLDSVLPITRAVARRLARIKSELWSRGTPVGENDLWIAATALEAGLILVSQDADFRKIPGLALEDWSC